MRSAAVVFLVNLAILTGLARGGLSREDLILQTQAADMLGESIGGAVEQAAATTRPAGAAGAATRPVATTAPSTPYRPMFDQLVDRIRKGQVVDDASLNNLDNDQLYGEMMALQSYNLQQYNRLLRAQPTTRPTLDSLLAGPKDSHWREKRQHIRNAVNARVQAARQRSELAPAMPAAPIGPSQPLAPQSYTWDDPRFHPYYYGPGDALNGWADPYAADPFIFQNGGGVYLRSDTRVNRDYDPRVGGDFDRRINIDYDRRGNVHVDPRQNY